MPANLKNYYGPHNLSLPKSGGLLLVRHAERPPILTAAQAYDTDITSAGREEARALGTRLGRQWNIGEVFASPVSRCLHTAEEIVNGAVNGARPHPSVTPLPVLHFDQKLTRIPGLAGIYLNDVGFLSLVSQPHSPAYALLRDTLLTALPIPTQPGVLNLACTHDVVITFLMVSLLGLPSATLADFPGYLEGILLIQRDGSIQLG